MAPRSSLSHTVKIGLDDDSYNRYLTRSWSKLSMAGAAEVGIAT